MNRIDKKFSQIKELERDIDSEAYRVFKAMTAKDISILKQYLVKVLGYRSIKNARNAHMAFYLSKYASVRRAGLRKGREVLNISIRVGGWRVNLYNIPSDYLAHKNGKDTWVAEMAEALRVRKASDKEEELSELSRLISKNKKAAREIVSGL